MIERIFTNKLDKEDSVYELFKWKYVDVKIEDYQTGEVIYEGHNLEFPEDYSQQACEIIASKYFYRNIDGEGTPETSIKQVVHRMARFWTEALIDEGLLDGKWKYHNEDYWYTFSYIEAECSNYFEEGTTARIFYDEIVYTLLRQMWAPNSPQWFNTGINFYGIKGDPDDFWYCDEEGTHKSTDRYSRSQTSACFIIPIEDHLIGKDSITDHFVTETKLFKGGSGVGTNFSPLRAEGEKLSSGGRSSGVMSFLLGLDRNAGAIKSGGTTRRAAKMVILDIDHPDIEDFIDWKVHEEKKARDLISLGYDGSLNGEAYQTVSGQNSNNSVRVSQKFMSKILGIDPSPRFELRGRKDLDVDKVVNAHDLWDKIAEAAWECADPGIQFDDKYNEWNTCANDGRINATNPCSEFAFLDNSACNLASINVDKFIWGGSLVADRFDYMIELIQYVLEASIHWGHYPTEDVARNSYKYRPTGLGLCNLASVFLRLKVPYDSDRARRIAQKLAAMMTSRSYLTSMEIADKVGACEGFENNREPMTKVIEKHMAYSEGTVEWFTYTEVLEGLKNGRGLRNMQVTVMAPTGTISLAMDCAATGIEPFFSHRMYKKCSDGSMMEIDNPLVERIIYDSDCWEKSSYHYDEYPGGYIEDYFDKHGTYQGCEYLTLDAQKILETANEISPEAHVKMMAAMQPHISGSISKTVNLPNDATVDDIKRIYELAYIEGCKSISIYRDGSKGAQPLNVDLDEDKEDDYKFFIEGYGEIPSEPTRISFKENPEEVYAEFREVSEEDDFPYCTVQEVDSEKPVFTSEIEKDKELVICREGKYIVIQSNQPLDFKISDEEEEPEDIVSKCRRQVIENGFIGINEEKRGRYQHVLIPEETVKGIQRKKPDSIRKGRTHTAKIGNVELYVTVSYYNTGGLCEVFVSSDKEGTTTKGLLSSLSKAISHMLQYGIEPEKIAQMLRNQQFEPAGHVERHKYIKMASSISDFIARVIEYECGDYSRCQVKPNDNEGEEIPLLVMDEDGEVVWKREDLDEPQNEKLEKEYEESLGYTGNECPICHSKRVVPNGSCELCLDCGSQSSCGG